MKQYWLSFGLAFVLAQVVSCPVYAQIKTGVCVASIHTPNGWWLHLNTNGSGRVGYGSSGGDAWKFKAGTFNLMKVLKDLKALPTEKGGIRSHFYFALESDRKGPDEGPPFRYTRDTKVIPPLFQKAVQVSDNLINPKRKELLLKKYPPGTLK